MNTMSVEVEGVATELDGLTFLWLEITGKCNLTCVHCYANSGPSLDMYGDMTFHDWVRTIEEAAEMGCRRLQFIGGEPTIHPRLCELVDHAKQSGFDFIEIYTNATRLDSQMIGCFQRNKVHVATSFYSDDPVTHDRITQRKGSWQHTVGGIQRALAADLPVRVGLIEMEENAGQMDRATDFLKGMGVRNCGVDRRRGVGRGSVVNLTVDGEHFDELCGQCWRGKVCVTASAQCFPCVFSRATPLGDVRGGLVGIVTGERLVSFRSEYLRHTNSGHIGADNSCGPGLCGPNTCPPYTGCNPSGDNRACQPDCRPL